MKTFVEFRSKKFPAYEGEEDEINPGIWGRRLAEYLDENLEKTGIATHGIIQEDSGYHIGIVDDSCRISLFCGHQYGDDEQFIIFTDPKTPTFRRFFRSIDVTPQLSRVVNAVKAILEGDPDIRDMEWMEQS